MSIKSYRPSNSTDSEVFQMHHCRKCIHEDTENDKYCQISGDAFTYEIDDPDYPHQWIVDPNTGKPTCTAFEPTRDAARIELSGIGGDLINYWSNLPMKRGETLTDAPSVFEGWVE